MPDERAPIIFPPDDPRQIARDQRTQRVHAMQARDAARKVEREEMQLQENRRVMQERDAARKLEREAS